MAKREIPLFIIDTSRKHKKGECDFIVCTDKDNGFIARTEYIQGQNDEVGDDYRITKAQNGISLKASIIRYTGANINPTDIRSLLKKGVEYFTLSVTRTMNINNPSRQECVDYIRILIRSNMKNLDEAKDYTERKIVLTSLHMLEAAIGYINKDENE